MAYIKGLSEIVPTHIGFLPLFSSDKCTTYDPPVSGIKVRDISYACMQASSDRAYGARVQSTAGLEENRRKI